MHFINVGKPIQTIAEQKYELMWQYKRDVELNEIVVSLHPLSSPHLTFRLLPPNSLIAIADRDLKGLSFAAFEISPLLVVPVEVRQNVVQPFFKQVV